MGQKNKIAKFLRNARVQVKHEQEENKFASFKSTNEERSNSQITLKSFSGVTVVLGQFSSVF